MTKRMVVLLGGAVVLVGALAGFKVLQIKAAINGAKRARSEAGKDIPILVQVTIETTGTLLVGADIAAHEGRRERAAPLLDLAVFDD